MNKFLTITIFFCAGLFFGSTPVEAALSVQFESTPLFLNANVTPGDQVERTVVVSNTGSALETVRASVRNQFSDGLSEVMRLTISSNSTVYFTGSFKDFFALPYAELGTLTGGSNRTYTFRASLPSTVGNPYQHKTLRFDLLIGFVGGQIVPDTPRGGGGGGGSTFSLFNEAVAADTINRSATITWQTNRDATTYLICADVGLGPVTLTTVPPLFGYAFTVPEVNNQVRSHSVTLNNLAEGRYECRPASRQRITDSFTVGITLRFSFPGGLVAGIATPAPRLPTPAPRPFIGSVLGVSKGTLGGPTYEEWRAEIDAERAAREAAQQEQTESANVTETESPTPDQTPQESGVAADPSPTTGDLRIVGGLGLAIVLLLLWLWWYNRRPQP